MFSHFLFVPMRQSPYASVNRGSYQARLDRSQPSRDGLSDTHLTFLWTSDEDTGPAVSVGFRFLGRPGPRRAGLRGVSSFLLAHATTHRLLDTVFNILCETGVIYCMSKGFLLLLKCI